LLALASLRRYATDQCNPSFAGTELSINVAQLETAVSETGAAQLKTFTNFAFFSQEAALEYAQEYLHSPPEDLEWGLLVGRPKFSAGLVHLMLQDEHWTWEGTLKCLKRLHTKS
jgi:hypothetical protein